jgi:hypothetical protein
MRCAKITSVKSGNWPKARHSNVTHVCEQQIWFVFEPRRRVREFVGFIYQDGQVKFFASIYLVSRK